MQQYLASASHGIAVKQELPDLFREALLPAGENTELEFFIFPKGLLVISCLRHGVSLVGAGPDARHLLVRIKGSDTFWTLEASVVGQEERRAAYHMGHTAAIISVINSQRLCASYGEFQNKAWTICGSWKDAWCMSMARSQFVFDGLQLNFLSSEAYREIAVGDLTAEIQRFIAGNEIAAAHFLHLLMRKGLWYYLPPASFEILNKVCEAVGVNRAYAFDGTDLTEHWLMATANELARILRSELEIKEHSNGKSTVLPS